MIVIGPWAAQLPDNKPNPKNYPWWPELVRLLPAPLVQVGVQGEQQLVPDFRCNLSMPELSQLIHTCTFWISCDSFLQHMAWDLGKPGVVLWGPSLPEIYGHTMHVNVRPPPHLACEHQFLTWSQIPCDTKWWTPPHDVIAQIQTRWNW